MFRPFPFRKRKSPELLEREAVGGFGTCCFRMPLLFRCDFYPSRGRLKPIRQVGRCSIRLPLNHYRRGLSFPHCFCRQNAFSRPPQRESVRTPKLTATSLPLVLYTDCLFVSVRSEAPNAQESRGEAFGRILRLSSDRCHPARKNPPRNMK